MGKSLLSSDTTKNVGWVTLMLDPTYVGVSQMLSLI